MVDIDEICMIIIIIIQEIIIIDIAQGLKTKNEVKKHIEKKLI